MQITMRKIFFRITIFSLFFVVSGCESKIISEKHILWKGSNINIVLDGLKTHKTDQQEVSLLYGEIIFQTKNEQLKSINLTCIDISVGDIRSNKIYVDSIADILPENYVLKGNLTKIPVYWKMDNLFVKEQLNNKIVVYIKPGCELTR